MKKNTNDLSAVELSINDIAINNVMVCGIIEAYLSKCILKILESTECLIMKEIQTKFIFNRLFVITFSN